jgi:alkylation response protein AidB-like acyl-CoA dehydrogenase
VSQPINRYKADLREIKFRLFEQFQLGDILGKAPYAQWSREDVEMVIEELYKWVCDKLGPLDPVGDAEGCKVEDGRVKTPTGFRAAWKELYEAGWRSLSVPEELDGQGGPYTLHAAADELLIGANTAFCMYTGLARGVGEVVEKFGTPEQIETYVKKLYDGTWGGTMCLTEPHAGSDVGASTTKATRLGDGRYKLEGTKIFITGGDHDLADNIIHLVLARTEDASAGTKGLSLFLVPRVRLDGSGSNHVGLGGIEHKMGINGSATCVLNFGDGGECIGELVGTEEQQGIRMMFQLMNAARIAVGQQGLALGSAAYLNALDYARERKQGPSIDNFKDPTAPKVPIVEHADVKRMLIDMKAKVEGIRALVFKLAVHTDRAAILSGQDDEAAKYHQGQVDLLVPLVKAYGSDQGFEICATAIQVFGGSGYLKDHPVERYCRDAKIFSIYEGTNHIQALDLVGRKLTQHNGANFQAYMRDVGAFVSEHKEHPELGAAVGQLAKAMEALSGSAMKLWGWFRGGDKRLVPLNANRFLDMMSETTVAWLLLDGARIALEKLAELPADHDDRRFYEGKRHSAVYYALNVLPGVVAKAKTMANEDRSALDIDFTE